MKKVTLFFLLGILILISVYEPKVKAEENNMVKREFRGVWVATVNSIDIGYHISEQQYKNEITNILNTLEEYNFNALIFQVRPTNDAFYPSELNPWSKYLTGVEGRSPGWDPLEWMIEETHKRGMEFHAWLNPYRVSQEVIGNNYKTKDALISSLSDDNFAKKNPQYAIIGNDNKLILNPGEPAVKEFIIDTIDEIITNYDVDAIHFDDYFYPYSGVKGNEDLETYNLYKNDGETIAAWRRRNVDEVIEGISDLIHTYDRDNNKTVQFGISPFGIWRNVGTDPLGSDTRGGQSYDEQNADTRKWVKEEWLDYICPQIYWEIGHSAANYEVLVNWWADVVSGTKVNLYTGNAIYKYGTNSEWNKYNQIPNQIKLNRTREEVKGSIFFSYQHLLSQSSQALKTARSYIKQYTYANPALHPTLPLINSLVPGKVENVSTTTGANEENFNISWDKVDSSKYYVVYRFEKDKVADLDNPANIYKIVKNPDGNTITFVDNELGVGKSYDYYITVYDRNGQESEATKLSFESSNTGGTTTTEEDTTTTTEETTTTTEETTTTTTKEETTTTTKPTTTTTEETTTTTEQIGDNDDGSKDKSSSLIILGVFGVLVVAGAAFYLFNKLKRA